MSRLVPPRQRTADLEVRQVGDDTAVYDLRNDQLHVLTPGAYAVWLSCDGQDDASAMAVRTGLAQQEVDQALDGLAAASLIDFPGSSRRTFFAAVGVAAGAAAVTTIMAPQPAAALSVGGVTIPIDPPPLNPPPIGP